MFVKLTSGNPSLEDFLGKDLIGRLERLNLERLHWFERRPTRSTATGKSSSITTSTAAITCRIFTAGSNSVLDYRNYTIETGERFCLQSSPIVPNVGDG